MLKKAENFTITNNPNESFGTTDIIISRNSKKKHVFLREQYPNNEAVVMILNKKTALSIAHWILDNVSE